MTDISFKYLDRLSVVRSELKRIHGPKYHYTKEESLSSIRSGTELWMTRADSLLDEEEILYGISLFSDSLRRMVKGEKYHHMMTVFDEAKRLLRRAYIISLTCELENSCLSGNYGNCILELTSEFSCRLRGFGFHQLKDGDSYKMHYFQDCYRAFEGKVIYERDEQLTLVSSFLTVFTDAYNEDVHMVEAHMIIELLLLCIVLFKEKRYEKENEYRIGLLGNDKFEDAFNNTRSHNGRDIHYIKAQIPGLNSDLITKIHRLHA